ncbi:squalene/phytoene synthase [Zalerion maritima]|uniref:Squalene/phytoene synthase n=1 Tax=Zalerion maritima TaxID=339359 RepID=A0AAD5WUQ4_9PEZI|nr:squalene/phytoene synthase [Zalerion maritima]
MRRFVISAPARRSPRQLRHYHVSEADVKKARDYCREQLKKGDSDAHLVAACLPSRSRDIYLALRTLNSELVRLPDNTTNPTIGAMRFQFWRESMQKTFRGEPPRQPICLLLSSVLSRLEAYASGPTSQLSSFRFWIARFLQARESGLANRPFPSLSEVESTAENTYSTLLYCVLAGIPLRSLHVDHLASHVGKAVGIVAVLRGIPILASPPARTVQTPRGPQPVAASQQLLLLPLDVMAKARAREEDVFRQGPNAEGFRDAVFQVATRANDHLITARTMLSRLKDGQDAGHSFEHEHEMGQDYAPEAGEDDIRLGFRVLLEALPTQAYLDNLQKADFDPWKVGRSWKLPWRLFRAMSTMQI